MNSGSEFGERGTGSARGPELTAEDVYVFPVTFAQQHLLLEQQLDPTNTSYTMKCSIRMTGQLKADVLERSLNEIVRRHEILRTTFTVKDGQPAQVVSSKLHIPLIVVDLSGLREPEREAQSVALKEAQTRVDLGQAPLVRTKLLRLAAADHVLLVTMHRAIFDPWSRHIFVTELATLYEAFCAGRQSSLPELSLQYADYAVWQRNYLQGENLDKLLSYWKEQLAGARATLDLPTDRPRPILPSFRGEIRTFVMSPNLYEQVTHTSCTTGATLFMILLAGFLALLSRYSEQDEIVVGTPIANRNRAEIEDLIGQFANILALRIKLDGDPTFGELLERVKETSLGAYAHQDMPFERLMEELRPERSLSHSPLFPVLFSLQHARRWAFELSGLRFEPLGGVIGTTAKCDISVFLLEDEGLSGRVVYNADLFNAATIDRMLQHYLGLLEAALNHPATNISRLPLRLPSNAEASRRPRGSVAGLEYPKKAVLPRNDLEATILRVCQQVLGLDSIGVTHNFFDVGGHSLLAIRLIAEIQNATGKRLPVSTLFEGPTVAYLADKLSRLDQSPTSLIAEIQGGHARPPFFGIVAPGARGLYTPLAQHLGKDQPLYRIQSPSPHPEGRPYTPIEYENFAAEYILAMKTAQPRGPYYFGGGCQGARIAFDMARLLEAQGETVGLLAIFDTWVIENSRNRLLFAAEHYSRCLIQFWHGTRHEKSQTMLRAVKQPFRRRGPSDLLKAALWPGPDFVPAMCATRITVFKTPIQRFYYVTDPLLGWGTRTTGGVEVRLVDARHRQLLREPDVRRLAEKLADSLDDAVSRAEEHGRKKISQLVGSATGQAR
jgi:thioesterase domain-containing protein